jgi:hypothetical protein
MKPHLLGIGENPEIFKAREIVMVNREGLPLSEWVQLEREYGCKFWINQRGLIAFFEGRVDIYRYWHRKSEVFLEEFDDKKRRLERDIKEADSSVNIDENISIPKLHKSNLVAQLRTLDVERIEHIESEAKYREKIRETENESKLATEILTAIESRHSHCFNDKTSIQLK